MIIERLELEGRRITELERLLAKERRINIALMSRVERSTDLQGGAFQLFETAIALEGKVRDRTSDLARALDDLAATNAALGRSQAEAEEARRRLADAIESSNEGFAIFDADDRLVLCNTTYLGLWPRIADRIHPGVSFGAIAAMAAEEGTTLGALAAPDHWVSDRLARHAVASGGHVQALADGRWIQINELRTSEGGIVGVYTDITEAKAEDARENAALLAERSVLLQATLDSIQAGVCVYDHDRRLVAWNDPARVLLRLPADVRAAIDTHAQLAAHCCAAIPAFSGCETLEWPGPDAPEVVREPTVADGRTLEVRRRGMPSGGVIISFADVTAERRAARALLDANDELERRVAERTAEVDRARDAAEEANRSKTHFLAAASHDLLQPLNAARLFVSALAERRLALPTRALVRQTGSALDSVEDLLEALLEISRLDAGAIVPEPIDFSIGHLLAALRSDFSPIARERGLALVFTDCPYMVRSDPRLLRRILQNLISNALRYTAAGEVRVSCAVEADQLILSVADTGPGIAAEHHETIFEEFRRLDGTRERGMGLGLAIVRRAARMLGHPVRLDSTPGSGSTFSVAVPLGAAVDHAVAPGNMRRAGRAGARVLVIDNEPAILSAMEVVLTGWGCRVTTAAGVDDALAHLRSDGAPDLLLADYHLDGTTGDGAVALVREAAGVEVPAIIITADRTPALRDRLGGLGLQVLTKPVKPAQLRALMGKVAA